jgi:hypothetical protein
MKYLLRKTILGIPVGLIAAILLVTSASAAWIMMQTVNFSVSIAALGPIDFIPDEDMNTIIGNDVSPGGLKCGG